MTIYGYARISKKKQEIKRQIENLKRVCPDIKIYQEAYTGRSIERPEFNKLLKRVMANDKIIFDSVSRMSRNAEEGFTLYEKLYEQGVELEFIKEPHINTVTYKNALSKYIDPTKDEKVNYIIEGINKYLMALAKEQIKIAFEQSQKEVDDLSQRTKEGLRVAKEKGHTVGGWNKGLIQTTKKSIEAKKLILTHSYKYGGNLTDIQCMKLAGITHNTYYKYIRELVQERETTSTASN